MTSVISQCIYCQFFDGDTCPAFPIEIPEDIFLNEKKHDKPRKEQKNEVVFAMRDGVKKADFKRMTGLDYSSSK